MLELLQKYSIADILQFVIILALAVKGVVSFGDWASARIKQVFYNSNKELQQKEELQRRLKHGTQIMDTLQQNQDKTDGILNDLIQKMNILVESDRDAIKAYITREHHYFCYQIGWIDDFSLECCERRFRHYKKEGGNSFIERFMEQLRALPKQDPQNKQETKGES